MFTAFRRILEGDAKEIWHGTLSRDILDGWNRLCQHFQPNADVQVTNANMDVIRMGGERAKNIAETRKLVTKLDEKIRK